MANFRTVGAEYENYLNESKNKLQAINEKFNQVFEANESDLTSFEEDVKNLYSTMDFMINEIPNKIIREKVKSYISNEENVKRADSKNANPVVFCQYAEYLSTVKVTKRMEKLNPTLGERASRKLGESYLNLIAYVKENESALSNKNSAAFKKAQTEVREYVKSSLDGLNPQVDKEYNCIIEEINKEIKANKGVQQ